jgi:hypothetical protein
MKTAVCECVYKVYKDNTAYEAQEAYEARGFI